MFDREKPKQNKVLRDRKETTVHTCDPEEKRRDCAFKMIRHKIIQKKTPFYRL